MHESGLMSQTRQSEEELRKEISLLKSQLAHRDRDLRRAMSKLDKIVEFGIAISAEQDINRLVETILQGAKDLAHADGGSLYLLNQKNQLEFQIVLNDSLSIRQGGCSQKPITLPPVDLFDAAGKPNNSNVVSHAYFSGQTINIADAYEVEHFDFSGTRRFDLQNGYRSQSFLTIPLRPRGGGIIGALQLINAHDSELEMLDQDTIRVFTPEMQRFVEALAAEAATALYNRDLLETQKKLFENQKQLFDAMINFIADAIDAKSHYTGSHCKRVPELALMIVEAACQVKEGPLADFDFKTEDEWYEFKVAALLHDCGKVTTPEFVVDKASKLETISNRIHEIRTRFEVLHRDARVSYLEKLLVGQDAADCAQQLKVEYQKLYDDFEFVASCNLGEDFMSPARIKRLQEISQKNWVRHFDDRLGLSWEEQRRFDEVPQESLPYSELLIADKPEHIIRRKEEFYSRYVGHDFTLPVPEHLYNNGELYNLSIAWGTLNTEERFKINEHIMQTIVMLERLPLPEGLKKVPHFAGTHHENLLGTGYPRNLKAEQLSIPARIMTIADIFEALTAADRPYKKPKALSNCLTILYNFKKEGLIDPVIFDLFLTSGIYRRYAEEYLKPDQVDEVDIQQFLDRQGSLLL